MKEPTKRQKLFIEMAKDIHPDSDCYFDSGDGYISAKLPPGGSELINCLLDSGWTKRIKKEKK